MRVPFCQSECENSSQWRLGLSRGRLILAGLAVVLWHASNLLARAEKDVLKDVALVQRLNEPVPLHLPFRDETGKTVELGQYFDGKPAILSLVYYNCPMLCPLALDGLLHSLQRLKATAGDQFNVLTVSFDPRDTPEMAASKSRVYLRLYNRHAAARGWHFLTGSESSIRRLTEAIGFQFKYDPDAQQFAHATGLMLLTPEGKIARYFYGIDYSTRDLRLALGEASAGKIGSLTDQILLFCYHYDPTTGRYGLMIMRVIRGAGLLTLALVGGGILVMLRRERH